MTLNPRGLGSFRPAKCGLCAGWLQLLPGNVGVTFGVVEGRLLLVVSFAEVLLVFELAIVTMLCANPSSGSAEDDAGGRLNAAICRIDGYLQALGDDILEA